MALANSPGPLFSATYETACKPIQTHIKDFWHFFGTYLGMIPKYHHNKPCISFKLSYPEMGIIGKPT